MEETHKGAILAILILIFTLTSAYFFSMSELKISSILTPNTLPLIESMFGTNFIVFLITTSISIALILFTIKKMSENEAIIISAIGYLIGGIGGCLIFGMLEYILPISFGFIGIIISAKTMNKKEKELKYASSIRAASFGAGKIITLICIGFFIYLILITAPNQKTYEENFVSEILDLTIGDTKSLQTQLNEPIIDLVIQTQKGTIQAIKSAPTYTPIKNSANPENVAFVLTMNEVEKQISSEAYKEQVTEQIQSGTQKQNIGEETIKQIPFIVGMSKYIWFIYCFSALVISLMIGNIVVKNISAIIYLLLIKIFPENKIKQISQNEDQNQ